MFWRIKVKGLHCCKMDEKQPRIKLQGSNVAVVVKSESRGTNATGVYSKEKQDHI